MHACVHTWWFMPIAFVQSAIGSEKLESSRAYALVTAIRAVTHFDEGFKKKIFVTRVGPAVCYPENV